MGIKKGIVDGAAIGLPGIEKLPGLQWKLINISKMPKAAHGQALEKLDAVLNV